LSGIVGIFQRDGAPIDGRQLRPLVDSLKDTGPDAQNIWAEGPAALGHALLRTSAASEVSSPNNSQLQITADVHLDSRAQLRAEIIAAGRPVSPDATDAQLLLLAYAAWGQQCVQHLRGEFAFAIWDAKSHALFCARDHFGIKSFYYALFDSVFLFSNALNTLRLDPRVSAELNDSAVADFLLFGLNCDNATSTFRDIQRLPPAHSLLVSRDSAQLRRYWDVPIDGRIRYRNANDYIENFLAVWKPAVADRLDAHRTGILLSGGLDSAAVAATAKELSAHISGRSELRAYTVAHNLVPQDRDPAHAAQLALALEMPQQNIYMDGVGLYEQFDGPHPIAPEPVEDPLFAGLFLTFETIAQECRVVLSGEGADNLMHFQMWAYAADLRRRGEYGRLMSEIAQYAWRRPFPWRGIRARLQGLFGKGQFAAQPFPRWIAADFAKRLDLRARWQAGQPRVRPVRRHPIHPAGHASMYLPQWTSLFEMESPGVTKSPVEVRYPFLDLRVVEYLLAIPPFPWFFQKALLRQAMAGRVLDSVRLRPKSPFLGDPALLQLQRFGPFGVKTGIETAATEPGRLPWRAELDLYINHSFLEPLHGKMTAEQVCQMARPLSFNFWLRSVRKIGYN
jgi:asparagine synthase (glutamine-hydrolysing)